MQLRGSIAVQESTLLCKSDAVLRSLIYLSYKMNVLLKTISTIFSLLHFSTYATENQAG